MGKPKVAAIHIQDDDGKIVAKISQISDEDADRLVMCWNAFRGMPTETIQTMPGSVLDLTANMSEMYALIETFGTLLRQVDQLLRLCVPDYSNHEACSAIKQALEFVGHFKRPSIH